MKDPKNKTQGESEMIITRFVVLDEIEPTDEIRTIEQAAENLKQTIISTYYEKSGTSPAEPPAEHDRIILTAGVTTIE